MVARFRIWWQQIKKNRVPILVIAIILVVVIALIIVGYKFDWTGFAGKTLWDWFNLIGVLAVPVVVGFGAIWFTTQQGKLTDAENKDNQRETALQSYIDKISELLLRENLRESADEEVRKIARVRTLTVLRSLDAERKGSVLRFLHESGLIDKDKYIIDLSYADLNVADLRKADLSGANLGKADLFGANLRRANLSRAILSGAKLSGANLYGAKLSGAILREANLDGANLDGANLDGATVTPEQLDTAYSLKDTNMPDGSKHP